MPVPGRINPDDFPDSVYARELGPGVAQLRFSSELETLYQQSHLQRVRLRVRVWFSFLAAVALLDAIGQLLGRTHGHVWWAYALHGRVWWAYALRDACAFALAVLSWSPSYQRTYMSAARVLVPLLGAATAVFVAQAVALGQGEQLAALTAVVFGTFFFAGLLFRAALFAAAIIIATFALTAAVISPVHAAMPTSLAILVLATTICVIGYRDIEQSYRRSFLENTLIAELVASDELTRLMNRRAFHEHLLRLWHHAQRDQQVLAVLMVDVDHFKSYNDTYGHQAGDAALQTVARLLQQCARRPLDLAARYGGDEFVAVLCDLPNDPPADHVRQLAERLRSAVQDAGLPSEAAAADATDASAAGPFTISIGVGIMVPALGRSMQGGVQLADEALYEAKKGGRNRVVVKAGEDYYRLNTGSFRKSVAGDG